MQRIAFLGLGIMGSRMAGRLVEAGYVVTVWNRTSDRVAPLIARGAHAAASPAEAVKTADLAITMLGDPASVKDVALGVHGLIDALPSRALYVDMTTVDPETSRALACACAARAIGFLDAPVTGSKMAAETGELVIMVGGSSEDLARAQPVFVPLAKRVVPMGPVGAGSLMKLANNLAIAGSMLALFEAFALGRRSGLADEGMLEVLTHGALASPLLALKARAVMTRDFTPHFALKHMAKDIRLVTREAAGRGITLPLADVLHVLFTRGSEEGYDEEDFAALSKVVER